MKKLLLYIISALFVFQINAQSIAYQAEDNGYITQVIETKAGKVMAANRQNDIYLYNNHTLITLVSAPGCARYMKLSPDSAHIGFKYIHQNGMQQAAVLDLLSRKITFLTEPVPLCGQPTFDAMGNIYFTLNDELIIYNNGILKRIKLPLYVNFVAISSDGTYAAFADDDKGIYVLNLLTNESKIIATPACFYPAFSFDNKYIAYGSNPHFTYVYDIINNSYFGPFDMAGFKWHPYQHKLIGIHSEAENFELQNSDIWEIEIPSQQIHKKTQTTSFESFANYDANGNIITSYLNDFSITKILSNNQNKHQLTLSEIKQSALFPNSSTKSDVTVPGTVPYVHQVYDTPSWHSGYGSCAPTTSIMALAYYNRLPKWSVSVDHGKTWDPHINDYGSYVADRYRFNEWYYQETADDYAGNTSYGGYGYMWTGSYTPNNRMKNYIQNHYLTSNQYWTTSCTYTATTTEIDNGYVHPICCYLTTSGHLVLAIGYKTGQHTLIFNDPYGNKNTPGYPSYDGAYTYYDWPGYNNGYVNLDANGSFGTIAWTVDARGTQPAYSDTIIDDNHFNHGFYMSNVNNGSHMRYFRDFNVGYGNHCWYTLGMATGSDICYCTWTPNIQQNGYFNVKAFIPSMGTSTTNAKYKIYHANGVDSVIVNQSTHRNQWVDLGTYYFTTTNQKYVYLGDLTGTSGDSIAFDCVKFSPMQVDNTPPTTSVSTVGTWKTQDFTASFSDNDNIGVEKSFYQVLDFDGHYWGANASRGFFGDNFDTLQPYWNIYTGNWTVSNGELMQTDENEINSNIYTSLQQILSNRYLYHFKAKVSGSGTNKRFGFHFFSDNGNMANRGNSYFIWFRVEGQTLEFYKVTNDTLHQQSIINGISTNTNQWYDFKITYDRITGKICVWRDDVFLGTWTDPAPYSTNGNYISFRTGNCAMNVTELKVYRSRAASTLITIGDSTKDIRYQNSTPNTFAAKIKSIVVDTYNNLSAIEYHDLNVDWTAPTPITTVNDGSSSDIDSIFTNTQVDANWTAAADSNSNVAYYEVSLGTQPCLDDVVSWTNVGLSTQYLFTSLNLNMNQNYYINVRATNNAGLTNNCSSSDGFQIINNVTANFYAMDTLLFLPNAYAIFVNTSTNAQSYLWDFGDGTTSTDMNPFHLYTDTGHFTVSLKAVNFSIQDSIVKQDYIHVKQANSISCNDGMLIEYYPNPIKDKLNVMVPDASKQRIAYEIKNISGQSIKSGYIETNTKQVIDFSTLNKGYYIVEFENEKIKKLSIIKQ